MGLRDEGLSRSFELGWFCQEYLSCILSAETHCTISQRTNRAIFCVSWLVCLSVKSVAAVMDSSSPPSPSLLTCRSGCKRPCSVSCGPFRTQANATFILSGGMKLRYRSTCCKRLPKLLALAGRVGIGASSPLFKRGRHGQTRSFHLICLRAQSVLHLRATLRLSIFPLLSWQGPTSESIYTRMRRL